MFNVGVRYVSEDRAETVSFYQLKMLETLERLNMIVVSETGYMIKTIGDGFDMFVYVRRKR